MASHESYYGEHKYFFIQILHHTQQFIKLILYFLTEKIHDLINVELLIKSFALIFFSCSCPKATFRKKLYFKQILSSFSLCHFRASGLV